MESTLFINTTQRVARAGITGVVLPAASCTLLAQWQVRFGFFETGAAVAELAAATLRFALKASPSSAALVFTSTFTVEDDFHVADISSVDSSALRTLLGDLKQIEAVGEIEWTIDGRRERVHFPVTVINAWLRPDDTAPDPIEEASVTWLNEQFAARITAGGYFEIQNADGDWFNFALNSGRAPE